MESILDTNAAYESFDFSKLQLIKPTLVSGGNYFIRCLVDREPLYIQPPKCYTKQGIMKASGGKRFYTDLMFTNENETFIHWMEKLESHCQQTIFKNRQQWFDNELEMDDVESYFTSPLKLFKSGKFYIARINISNVLGKPTIKFYNEDEQEINFESINDKLNVMTILEIQGVKCSAKSFQIEIELKQMMALKQQILFDKCLFKTKDSKSSEDKSSEANSTIAALALAENQIDTILAEDNNIVAVPEPVEETVQEDVHVQEHVPMQEPVQEPLQEPVPIPKKKSNDLEEVDFNLDELPNSESVQIKQRNEVYYEMYREARKKAKIARDLALAAYLEAKEIKNTYMLTDVNSDSDSDGGDEGTESFDNSLDNDLENDIEELDDSNESFGSREKIKIEV